MYFFQSIKGSDFEKAMLNHYKQNEKWSDIANEVEEILGEKIGYYMAPRTDTLHVDPWIIEKFKEENVKLFKKDGELKSNSKAAKELLKKYQEIIKKHGLTDYVPKAHINFTYGVIRTHRSQTMESFFKDERYYIKCSMNFLEEKKYTADSIVAISEVEYEEAYLELIKSREDAS